jgi:hypothetical protein
MAPYSGAGSFGKAPCRKGRPQSDDYFPHFSKKLVLTDEDGTVIYAAQIAGRPFEPPI